MCLGAVRATVALPPHRFVLPLSLSAHSQPAALCSMCVCVYLSVCPPECCSRQIWRGNHLRRAVESIPSVNHPIEHWSLSERGPAQPVSHQQQWAELYRQSIARQVTHSLHSQIHTTLGTHLLTLTHHNDCIELGREAPSNTRVITDHVAIPAPPFEYSSQNRLLFLFFPFRIQLSFSHSVSIALRFVGHKYSCLPPLFASSPFLANQTLH